MLNVTWRYIILDHATFFGHRVKKIKAINPADNPYLYGNDAGDPWTRSAPTPIAYHGDNYVFAFWALTGYEKITQQPFAQVYRDPAPNLSLGGQGMWSIWADAWYVWDFGQGGGDNGIAIDAFDIEARDFMAQDFVHVTKDDQAGTLTTEANDGFMITKALTEPEVITADEIRGYQFSSWKAVDTLTSPQVGGPTINAHDISNVQKDNRMVAFAFYNEVKIPPPAIVRAAAPIFVIALSDAGPVWVPLGTPPGPIGPGPGPLADLFASSRLLEAAHLVSAQARAELLRSAEKMARAAADAIKKEGQRD